MIDTHALDIRLTTKLPGFPDHTHFKMEFNKEALPFCTMTALLDANISFLLGDPFVFHPEYEFDIPDEVLRELEIERREDIEIWGIITYRGSFEKSTINLQAPLIINARQAYGRQLILGDSTYSVRHSLVRIPESGGTVDAGTEP